MHQVLDSLFIKWTPNQLMNVNEESRSVNCNHDKETEECDISESETSRYRDSKISLDISQLCCGQLWQAVFSAGCGTVGIRRNHNLSS